MWTKQVSNSRDPLVLDEVQGHLVDKIQDFLRSGWGWVQLKQRACLSVEAESLTHSCVHNVSLADYGVCIYFGSGEAMAGSQVWGQLEL